MSARLPAYLADLNELKTGICNALNKVQVHNMIESDIIYQFSQINKNKGENKWLAFLT